VYPSGNTTYTLTVIGQNGQSATCQTAVTVNTQQYQAPYCTINANPTSITQGQSSTLIWSSTNATNATLSSQGTVAANGSMSVTPYQTTTYQLTVYSAQGQSATCSATVALTQPPYIPPYQPPYQPPYIPPYQPPYQPPIVYPPTQTYYPNIPLRSIPYTGDTGTAGNMIVLSLEILASLSGAYLILYSRGGARNLFGSLKDYAVAR
jgi:hypothetical protein